MVPMAQLRAWPLNPRYFFMMGSQSSGWQQKLKMGMTGGQD